MTRILYLSADPGVPVCGHKGASVHVRELARSLVAAGADVHIASPRVEFEGDALPEGVHAHAIGAIQPRAHGSAASVRAALAAQEREVTTLACDLAVDAIYERLSLFGAAGVRAASSLALPHALEANAPMCEESERFRTLPFAELARELETEALTRTGAILAVSAELGKILAGQGADPVAIRVQPNGVSVERFPAPRRDDRRFVAGFAGSLKPWHGVETIVEAVGLVPDVHLEVVGHGPMLDAFDGLPRDRVRTRGALAHDRVLDLMSTWDVGLAPYEPLERFWFSPLKVLEYMAAGSCAVASDIGEVPAVLGAGARGVLVPPGDADALADALATLARDRDRARQLGSRARAWVSANRRWSDNAEGVLDALGLRRSREAA